MPTSCVEWWHAEPCARIRAPRPLCPPHTSAPSRRQAPELCRKLSPFCKQRAWGMPGAQCTRSPVCAGGSQVCTRVFTAEAPEITRHSRTRMVLTAYGVLSPATNSSCHRRRRMDGLARPVGLSKDLRRLDTSNGCQDHTLLPSATMPLVSPARESLTGFHPPCDPFACTTSSRPPHPTPTFVTIASRPSSQGWDGERGATDF